MPRKITAQHQWVIAATIGVEEPIARKGVQRGVVRIAAETKIDVMETYCAMCRKTYEDVADIPCSAAVGTEHLRGGPIGVRAKRGHAAAVAVTQLAPVEHQAPVAVPTAVPVAASVAVAAPVPVLSMVRPSLLRPTRPRRQTRPQNPAFTEWMLPFVVDATLTG